MADLSSLSGEVHSEPNYAKDLAKTLNEFRKRNVMCDAVLIVGRHHYMAHRNVLSAASPFFLDKFQLDCQPRRSDVSSVNPFDEDHFEPSTPSLGSQVEVHSIGVEVIEDVLNFIYLGEVCVHQENVRQLVAAADYLRMTTLKEIACRFFEKRLSPSNCLSISSLADEFSCSTLKQAADKFIFKHFVDVSKYSEFKALNSRQVIHIIASDEIEVMSEEQVFEAVMSWLHHDIENRGSALSEIMSQVRFPLISKYYLADRVETDELIQSDEKCMQMLIEAKTYSSLTDRQHCYQGCRFQPRKSLNLASIIIASGGNQSHMSSSESLCYIPETDFWYPLAPMLYPRSNYSAVLHNGYFYAIGGLSEESATRKIERYSFVLDRWEELRPLPELMCNHGSAVFNGEIYVVGGGKGDSSSNTVLKYVEESGHWEAVANLKIPRRGCAVVGHRQLYAIGGYGPNGSALASVERYNPYYNEWAKIFPMNAARAFASAICIGNRIFVFGGEYAMWSYYRTAEMFNITTDEWTNIADMAIPRALMGIASASDKIYLVGGMVTHDDEAFGTDDDEESFVDANEVNLVECYDIYKNTFEKACSLPMATANLCCVSVNVPKKVANMRCGI